MLAMHDTFLCFYVGSFTFFSTSQSIVFRVSWPGNQKSELIVKE